MIDEKKIIEDNFDRMMEIISNTWLPTKNEYGDVVGETRLGTGDIFRLATALNCQEYIFGKQSYRLKRCREEVDVIITDSPLPLTIIYTKDDFIKKPLTELVMAIYNSYDNINFFINRVKPYNPKGRNQTAEESDALSFEIKKLYQQLNIPYIEIDGNTAGYDTAVAIIMDKLNNKN